MLTFPASKTAIEVLKMMKKKNKAEKNQPQPDKPAPYLVPIKDFLWAQCQQELEKVQAQKAETKVMAPGPDGENRYKRPERLRQNPPLSEFARQEQQRLEEDKQRLQLMRQGTKYGRPGYFRDRVPVKEEEIPGRQQQRYEDRPRPEDRRSRDFTVFGNHRLQLQEDMSWKDYQRRHYFRNFASESEHNRHLQYPTGVEWPEPLTLREKDGQQRQQEEKKERFTASFHSPISVKNEQRQIQSLSMEKNKQQQDKRMREDWLDFHSRNLSSLREVMSFVQGWDAFEDKLEVAEAMDGVEAVEQTVGVESVQEMDGVVSGQQMTADVSVEDTNGVESSDNPARGT